MQLKTISLDEIIEYPNNTKIHTKEQIEQIKSSITEFGFNDPIAIDENNMIIEGHGRYLALKELDYKEVKVIQLMHLTEEQKRLYSIAHNKLTLNTDFDLEKLKIEFENLQLDDSDLELTGFSLEELDVAFPELSDNIEELDETDIPEPPEKPFSQRGDIYLLGNHKVMCGDSTTDDLKLLMDGEKAEMVFTDPPYLMGFTGNVHCDGSKSFNAKHGEIKNDKMSRVDGDKFIESIFKQIKDYVNGAFYVCFYRLGLDYLYRAIDKQNIKHRALIIWNKGNHTLSNSDYMSKYEPIMYGWISKHNFYGDKSNFDIWDIQRTQKNEFHPTMKPIELCMKAIKNSSNKGELVLDLFGGSGSTLIASEHSQRKAYLMELDEKYVDVILKRYINLGKSDVVLIRDGKRIEFSELPEKLTGG